VEYQILIQPDPDQYRVFRGRIREDGLRVYRREAGDECLEFRRGGRGVCVKLVANPAQLVRRHVTDFPATQNAKKERIGVVDLPVTPPARHPRGVPLR